MSYILWTSQSLNNSAVYTDATYLIHIKLGEDDAMMERRCSQHNPNLHLQSKTNSLIQSMIEDTFTSLFTANTLKWVK